MRDDTILVVDDSPAGLYYKAHVLRGAGYTVAEATSARDALAYCRSASPAMLLLDVWLPDMHGVELCRQLKAEFPGIVVLQTSAAATSAHDRALALEGGADSFMVEPIEPEELRAVAAALLRMRSAEHALRRLNETLEQTVVERTQELRNANQQLEIEIAERRKAEDALWHAQKMEAIGQLTGGIAHDFNNLLAVITGGLEMVRRTMETNNPSNPSPGDGSLAPGNDRLLRLVSAAQSAAERGASLTSQLLAFARRSPLRTEVASLQEIFAASEPLFRRALGETIELHLMLPADLWPCQLDPAQLEAAILNLVVNARDAMPDGGVLEIAAENQISAPAEGAWAGAEKPGPCVCLRISDTGTGMEPDVVARVFEPFFTTKGIGKGTGLGLSQVYGFVRQSAGHIELESVPGGGTTFRLYLPRAATDVRPELTRALVGAAHTGSQTILVVEDDTAVREMAVMMLTELGYKVLTASDALDALTVLADRHVDLLFSDVVMPGGMSGYDLVRQAWKQNHDLKALLTSGYAHGATADPDLAQIPMLLKPYKHAELAARVRLALDSA